MNTSISRYTAAEVAVLMMVGGKASGLTPSDGPGGTTAWTQLLSASFVHASMLQLRRCVTLTW